MTRRLIRLFVSMAIVAGIGVSSGCVYYNTFYNARKAWEFAEKNRRDQEERRLATRNTLEQTSEQSRGPAGDLADGQRYTPQRTFPAQQNEAGSTPRTAQAMRTMSPGDLYRVAIEKSAKVIAYYPKSDYLDDALLLMAKSYYRLGEYGSCLRKTDEVLATFASSALVPEATYWRGMALWKLGRRDEAVVVLRNIVDGRTAFRGNAAYALAELERAAKNLPAAIDLYEVAATHADDPLMRGQAREAFADALLDAGRHREAVNVYGGIAREARSNEARYQALVKIARAYRAAGNHAAALAVLEPLRDDEHFIDFALRTRLEIARVFEEKGEMQAALALYGVVLDEARRKAEETAPGATSRTTQMESRAYAPVRPGQQQQQQPARRDQQPRRATTVEEAEAHLRLGLIQERRYGNLARAGEHYEVAAGNTASEAGKDAVARKGRIERWRRLHAQLADTAIAPDSVARAVPTFELAEHFCFELENVDSALVYYTAVVERFGTSPIAPKARYAIGWLWLDARKDTVRADSVWQAILDDTTRSALIVDLKRAIAERRGFTIADPAREPFAEAERAWFDALDALPPEPPAELADSLARVQWWDRWAVEHAERSVAYADILRDVVRRWPESPYATRSRFILGWLAENVQRDTTVASTWYRAAIADSLIAPDIAAMARTVIDLRTKPSAGAEPPPAPTVATPGPAATTPASTGATFPTAVETPPAGENRPATVIEQPSGIPAPQTTPGATPEVDPDFPPAEEGTPADTTVAEEVPPDTAGTAEQAADGIP